LRFFFWRYFRFSFQPKIKMNLVVPPIKCTPDEFARVRAAFQREGVPVPDGDRGAIDYRKIKANFNYDGETLSLVVTDKPYLYPPGTVVSRISEFINSAIHE
jgi:hypothetical protein